MKKGSKENVRETLYRGKFESLIENDLVLVNIGSPLTRNKVRLDVKYLLETFTYFLNWTFRGKVLKEYNEDSILYCDILKIRSVDIQHFPINFK